MSRDELIAQAELGEEAQKFLQSDLYKVMVGFAEQDLVDAQLALESVSPTDTAKIVELQNTAKCARNFSGWLHELVDEGNNAIQVFKQQEE